MSAPIVALLLAGAFGCGLVMGMALIAGKKP